MTFYAITIPPCPGFGFEGGAQFDTLIRALNNGRNRRSPRQHVGIHHFVSPMNNIPVEAARAVKKVHMAMLGAAHTFLHLDYLDFEATDEPFGTGTGSQSEFLLTMTYDPGGGATYERLITKPDVDGNISVNGDAGVPIVIMVDGSPVVVDVDPATGIVDFGSSPPILGAALTWTGRFYVCVRFNRDDLPFSIDNKSGTVFITNGTLELIEELDE